MSRTVRATSGTSTTILIVIDPNAHDPALNYSLRRDKEITNLSSVADEKAVRG
jgi:hypothetical protein